MFAEWIAGAIIAIPEIVDSEIRRSLSLTGAQEGIRRLDALYSENRVRLISFKRDATLRAAELWAQVRRGHRPTASDKSIDIDAILSAQAMEFCSDADDWLIITENVDHIARYVGDRARSRRDVVNNWLRSSRSSV
jgi:hypothetical protein